MGSNLLGQSCPCLYTTPCHPDCPCLNPFMSRPCRRCCSVGNPEQRKVHAEWLARKIDAPEPEGNACAPSTP